MKNWLFILSIVLLLISGCRSELGVYESSKEQWLENRIQSPLTGKGMSYVVKNYLTEQALDKEYVKDPERVLKRLDRKFEETKDQKALLALIELCYAQGRAKTGLEALSYFLSSAAYSATFFDTAKIPDPTPFSPHFLYICRAYNYAIAEIIKIMQQQELSFQKEHDIPILQGMMHLNPPKSALPYPFKNYKKFLLCNDYVPYGFLTSSRSFGMGVPLITIQNASTPVFKVKSKGNLYTLAASPSPATAFLRIKTTKPGQYQGTMEFFDPYKVDSFEFEGRKAPLEVDITTPFAYLTREGAAYSGFSALANPKYMHLPEGLFLLTPYDKDKIPLVIVHGLMSRPRTWAQMINTLMNNDRIRRKYQIWLFAYPTGFPVLLSAAKLRQALLDAQSVFDPQKSNPNFNDMVILGHSMGGLLTRSMVQNSGNKIVDLIFETPIAEMKIPEADKKLLKEAMIFESLPFVKRVIFMSTPHRGSEMTHWTIMKWAQKFITLPMDFVTKLGTISKNVVFKQNLIKGSNKTLAEAQGVDSLDPNNIIMQFMAEQPITAKYHSIIGNDKEAGVIGGTDGIVTYKSAHLDGAESELVILSGHNTQKQSAGIKEVRRILLLHLDETGRK